MPTEPLRKAQDDLAPNRLLWPAIADVLEGIVTLGVCPLRKGIVEHVVAWAVSMVESRIAFNFHADASKRADVAASIRRACTVQAMGDKPHPSPPWLLALPMLVGDVRELWREQFGG